ncbi:MAG: glycerophosphodiester phosphodiesterase [Acidobacteria bacterium]|nr:MAG: glycerophosphodiester phosphodiesterase [Acidobacteriota bacterium]
MPVHGSRFTVHGSRFTVHGSRFTVHGSGFRVHQAAIRVADKIRCMPRPHRALGVGRAQVFAHRGGAALRPENTIAAFDHGLSLGADGLEFDVHLSRDGVVVIHHDATLDRTTDHRGPVAALTAAELARVDAGHNFVPRGRSGQPPFRGAGFGIPTLREVLQRYRDIWMIIELKLNEPTLAHRTIDEVRAADTIDRVSLGSFGTRVLRAARIYEPRIHTGSSRDETRLALYRSWCRWPVSSPPFDAYQVPEFAGATRVVSRRFVEHAHRCGIAVQVWTVDTESDVNRLIDWGVDGIISDRPDIAVEVIRARTVNQRTLKPNPEPRTPNPER